MPKFQLGRKASDWFVTLYVLGTLYVRFQLEPQFQGNFLISVGLGAFALLFLWALAKSKFINPSWFGLGN
ncbi:MAG: hypothetical protein KDC43_24265 [Saprospiraceae bacterium]|nr:hypothetical protein [Saprospiraceae bacterium]MCB0626944.1 hypothetical protein [Saprospiraceae bacterium]MCB0676965.1 hypothetical protein [Saprospiraceae bacterium]